VIRCRGHETPSRRLSLAVQFHTAVGTTPQFIRSETHECRTEQAAERLAADTPKTTVFGNGFLAPKDWSIRINGPATVLTAPEGGSWVALVDVQTKEPDKALAAAWQAYKPDAKWPVKVTHDLSDQDGWSRRRVYEYLTSPNEKRGVSALVSYSGSNWTVVIEDLADAVAEKRGAQVQLVLGRLLPKGYSSTKHALRNSSALSSRDRRC
jgi:hypothetical protein